MKNGKSGLLSYYHEETIFFYANHFTDRLCYVTNSTRQIPIQLAVLHPIVVFRELAALREHRRNRSRMIYERSPLGNIYRNSSISESEGNLGDVRATSIRYPRDLDRILGVTRVILWADVTHPGDEREERDETRS